MMKLQLLTLVLLLSVSNFVELRPSDELLKIIRDLESLVDEETLRLRIGAFNIQIFGRTKMSKPDVVDVLLKVIPRYDILLVQEIRDSSGTAIEDLLARINSQESDAYSLVISERLGRTNSKEQYAYMYRHDRVQVQETFQFSDHNDLYERPPFCAKFSTNQVEGLNDFFLVGVHTDPDEAEDEVDALKTVYEEAQSLWGIEDAIILGDFNADCGYLTKSEWKEVDMRTDPRFTWLLEDDEDTTVSATNCAYDRIIVTGQAMSQAVVPRSATVYKFDDIFDLTNSEAKQVSDHYPVELELFALGESNPFVTKERITVESSEGPSLQVVNTLLFDDLDKAGYYVESTESGSEVSISLGSVSDPLERIDAFSRSFPALLSLDMLAVVESSLTEFLLNNPKFVDANALVRVVFYAENKMEVDVTYSS